MPKTFWVFWNFLPIFGTSRHQKENIGLQKHTPKTKSSLVHHDVHYKQYLVPIRHQFGNIGKGKNLG